MGISFRALGIVAALSAITFSAHAEEVTETNNASETEVARSFLEQYRAAKKEASILSATASPLEQSRDLALRTANNLPGILEIAPGLVVLHQAPGANADNFLWRGVNSVSGSAAATFVDDVPINLPAFRYPGYVDLHWVIPELVERVEGYPGPYYAAFGDYDTAGALKLTTRRNLAGNQALLSSGINSQIRGLVVSSSSHSSWSPLLAGEFFANGATSPSPDTLRRFNLFSKVTKSLGAGSQIALSLSAYSTNWTEAGLIPSRAVDTGIVPWRGAVSNSQGGDLQRYALSAAYKTELSTNSSLSVTAFGSRTNASLFSDNTFYLRDATSGDLSHDQERDTIGGAEVKYHYTQRSSDMGFDTDLGFQTSYDWAESHLATAPGKIVTAPIADLSTNTQKAGVYGQQKIAWGSWIQTVAGIRGDFIALSRNGANQDAFVVSPKAGLIIIPARNTQVFLNTGAGFHSSDPRATGVKKAISQVTGYEIGLRNTAASGRLRTSLSGFMLTEEASGLYNPNDGTTSIIGANSRLGVQAQARFEMNSWLTADFDTTLSKPKLSGSVGSANAVPFAPTRTMTLGVTARHPSGYYGRLSILNVADRAATPDRSLTADGFSRVDATLGYRNSDFQVTLGVLNVFNTHWKETQVAGVSKLSGETSCPNGCTDVLFTPGDPLTLQGSATVFF